MTSVGLDSSTSIVSVFIATVASLISWPFWVTSAFLRKCTMFLTRPKCWDLPWNVGFTFRSSCSGLYGLLLGYLTATHWLTSSDFFLIPWHKIPQVCNSCVLCVCNQHHMNSELCCVPTLHPEPVSIAVPGKTSLDDYFKQNSRQGEVLSFSGTFLFITGNFNFIPWLLRWVGSFLQIIFPIVLVLKKMCSVFLMALISLISTKFFAAQHIQTSALFVSSTNYTHSILG